MGLRFRLTLHQCLLTRTPSCICSPRKQLQHPQQRLHFSKLSDVRYAISGEYSICWDLPDKTEESEKPKVDNSRTIHSGGCFFHQTWVTNKGTRDLWVSALLCFSFASIALADSSGPKRLRAQCHPPKVQVGTWRYTLSLLSHFSPITKHVD